MTAVPVADMEGNMEQAAWFRFQKTDAGGNVLETKYFDTFACGALTPSRMASLPPSALPPVWPPSRVTSLQGLPSSRASFPRDLPPP